MSGGGGIVRVGAVELAGDLVPPAPGRGVVLFAHGSGSGRLSPRNNFVARELERAGLGTLLFDLLTPKEAADRRNVFDIDLLARRLVLVTDWLRAAFRAARSPIIGADVRDRPKSW